MIKRVFKYLLLITVVITAISCVRLDPPDREPKQNKQLEEITVPNDFNWSTSKKVELTITGLPTVVEIKSTLKITLTDGTTLYSALHNMSDNLKINLTVPSEAAAIVLNYGDTKQNLPIVNNKAEFSFIPVVQDEEV